MPKPGYRNNMAPAYKFVPTVTTNDADLRQRFDRGERVMTKACQCEHPMPLEDDDPHMDPRCLKCGKRIA